MNWSVTKNTAIDVIPWIGWFTLIVIETKSVPMGCIGAVFIVAVGIASYFKNKLNEENWDRVESLLSERIELLNFISKSINEDPDKISAYEDIIHFMSDQGKKRYSGKTK